MSENKGKYVTIGIRVTKEEKICFEGLAKARGCTLSDIMRLAVKRTFDEVMNPVHSEVALQKTAEIHRMLEEIIGTLKVNAVISDSSDGSSASGAAMSEERIARINAKIQKLRDKLNTESTDSDSKPIEHEQQPLLPAPNKPNDMISLYFGSNGQDFKDIASQIIQCMITELISKEGYSWNFDDLDCILYSSDECLLEIIAKFSPEFRKKFDNLIFRAAAFSIARYYSDEFLRSGPRPL